MSIFSFYFLLTDDIIKLNKKEERKQYSPKMKRGLQQNRTRQFRTPSSKWGIQQQKGAYAEHNVDCTVSFFELKCNLMKCMDWHGQFGCLSNSVTCRFDYNSVLCDPFMFGFVSGLVWEGNWCVWPTGNLGVEGLYLTHGRIAFLSDFF